MVQNSGIGYGGECVLVSRLPHSVVRLFVVAGGYVVVMVVVTVCVLALAVVVVSQEPCWMEWVEVVVVVNRPTFPVMLLDSHLAPHLKVAPRPARLEACALGS